MLSLFQEYGKEAFAVVSVVVTFVLNRIFRLRPKLIYSVRHSTNYVVDQPLLDGEGKVVAQQQLVRTASIVSENSGLQPAKNVEYTFNWKPPIYNVFPGRAFSTEETGMNRWVLKLESLAPGEVFGLEILSINQELPLLTAVRSDEATGRLINMAPQRVWPAWWNRTAAALFILGVGTALYLLAVLIAWLAG